MGVGASYAAAKSLSGEAVFSKGEPVFSSFCFFFETTHMHVSVDLCSLSFSLLLVSLSYTHKNTESERLGLASRYCSIEGISS